MAGRIPFKQALKDQILVVDGAMGTQIYAHGVHLSRCFDEINLSNPYLIGKIHHDYIAAGARVLETNTFGASRVKLDRYTLGDRIEEVIAAGCKLAREARAGVTHRHRRARIVVVGRSRA